MKKFIALFLVLSLLCFAGCGTQMISGEVNQKDFYESISYPELLKIKGSVTDCETLYFPDGSTSQSTWSIAKNGDTYSMVLEYGDATVYFTGNDTFIDINGKLHYLSHFGWALDDYTKEYLGFGPSAPSVDFTIKRELKDGQKVSDKSYTVITTYTVGELKDSFAGWNLSETDTVTLKYRFDKSGNLATIESLCGSNLLSRRTFTYGEKVPMPDAVAEYASSSNRCTVKFSLHDEENETVEWASIPYGLPVYCGTGYKFFSDWEHETEWDYSNSPITSDITLTVWY